MRAKAAAVGVRRPDSGSARVPVELEVGGRPDGWGPPSGEVRGREWSGPGWGEGGLAV